MMKSMLHSIKFKLYLYLLIYQIFHHLILLININNKNNIIHPRSIKSCDESILNYLISGVAIITLGLPPNFYSFASASPNVLETFVKK